MCASVCMPPAAQEADADAHGFPPQFEFAEWQTEKRARLFSSTASGEAVDERRVRGRVDSFSTTRPSAGKDRHSKVNTSKGPRDRRVRLSVPTAVQFYEVQDRLGYDQPSKAVEWLMRKAKAAIDELAHLPMPPCPTSVSPPAQVDKHRYSQQQQAGVSLQPQLASECETPESVCGSKGDGGSGLSTRMESRAKARQRARERAKGKVGGRPALVASEAHYLQEEMSMHGLEQECLRKLQPVLTIHDYDLWQSHEERHPRHSSRLQQTSPSMRTGQRLDVAQSMCGGLSLAGLPAGDLTSSSWCCSPTFVNPGIGMGQPEHHVVGGPGKPPASWNDSTAFWETCVPGPNPLMMGPLQSTIPQGTRVPALRSLVKELHGSRSGDVV